MTDPIRWGILGAANFALTHMAPAIHAARDAHLLALATSDRAKAAPFAALAPGLRVHDGYDALLADPDIEAVYVPLPNTLHVEWALKALDAGKHVLVEKPVAMRAADIDAVIARRDETGLLAAEAFMIVHHPQWVKAREMLADGAIGELAHVDVRFSYNNPDPGNIRNRADVGGGAMSDIGVYALGGVRFATGEEPETIRFADVDIEGGVDVFAHFAADFPSFSYDGLVSTRLGLRQEVVFHGRTGVLTLPVPFNANVFGEARLVLERPGMEVTTWRFPGVNHYVLQVEAFGRSVRDGVPFACPLEFSRGTQAAMDAVLSKAREGTGR
ncbi:Gfo/Idh/MocA family protein [Wenxinia marina]|uniref:Putative dehydrogenase n=1 Tax=Wenxinia marina DSM 24838 TaxID=1123501 RepID=A0A0D0NHV0_9RHOB|nr:Gfo/Idh/MocA family oxidoreductase [Wenxinia marina]KIQ67925.1 putative dehydrogenase [Wenxinia marina DSM 24838]GGL76169.1 oxidoreductase [Wenxinia marina]